MGRKKDKESKKKEGKGSKEEKRHGGLQKEPSDYITNSHKTVLLRRKEILCHRLDPDQPDPLEEFFKTERAFALIPREMIEEHQPHHNDTPSSPQNSLPSKSPSSFGLGPSPVVPNQLSRDRTKTVANMLAPSTSKRRGTLHQNSLELKKGTEGRKATLPPSSAFIFPKQKLEPDLSSPRSKSPSLGRSQTTNNNTLRISPAHSSSKSLSPRSPRTSQKTSSSPLLSGLKKPTPPPRSPKKERKPMTKGQSMAVLVNLDCPNADRPLPATPYSSQVQLAVPSPRKKRMSTDSPGTTKSPPNTKPNKPQDEKPRSHTPPPTRSNSFGLNEDEQQQKHHHQQDTNNILPNQLSQAASESTVTLTFSQCSPARTTESATPRTPSPPNSYTSILPAGALSSNSNSNSNSNSSSPLQCPYASPNLTPASVASSSEDLSFLDSYASPIAPQYAMDAYSSPTLPSPSFSPCPSPSISPFPSPSLSPRRAPSPRQLDGYQSPINLGGNNAYTSPTLEVESSSPVMGRKSKWSSPKSATLYGQGKGGGRGGGAGGGWGNGGERASVERDSGDWNGRFQDMVGSFKVIDILDMAHSGEVILDLIRLNQDFLVNAETYGRIIIMERHLPLPTGDNKEGFTKTLIPMDIGGRAGGQKYLINNILFKFAVDVHNLYGSDYAAAKAAGNELRGLNAIFNNGNNKLCFPFMALIDFLGVRLIAMSRLPISADTLVYGTADGGVTVFNENQELSALIKDAAKKMQLAPHICGLYENRTKTLYTAADIEGHVGRDGRYYMIDFARMFPPTTPDPRIKRGYLYQVMRPEIVAMGHKLCPDTYSGFIAQDPKKSLYEAQVGAATEQLTTRVAKKVGQEIQVGCRLKGNIQRLLLHLPEMMHRRGLNLRYLGLLLNTISNPSARMLVILEAAARVIKNNLRSHIRQASQKLQIPMEAPYRELVVHRLNDLLCSSEKDQLHYWEENQIVETLQQRFNFSNFALFTKGKEEGMTDGLTEGERKNLAPDDPLRLVRLLSVVEPKEKMMGRWIVFKRVQEMTGIRFAEEINERFLSEDVPNTELALDEVDLEKLSVKVKRQSFVNTVQGLYFYSKALRESDQTKCKSLFQRAIRSYELCLQSDPTNLLSLVNAAQCCYKLALYETSGGKALTGAVLDPAEERVITADNLYQRALQIGESEPHVYYLYAQFLDSCQKTPLLTQKAEKYHLLGCERWPSSTANLHGYAAHLRGRGEDMWAEKFEEKANRCSHKNRGFLGQ